MGLEAAAEESEVSSERAFRMDRATGGPSSASGTGGPSPFFPRPTCHIPSCTAAPPNALNIRGRPRPTGRSTCFTALRTQEREARQQEECWRDPYATGETRGTHIFLNPWKGP